MKMLARIVYIALGVTFIWAGVAKLIDDDIPFHGLRFEGRRFDCGGKAGFLQANIAFALERDDLRDELMEFLKNPSGSS